jgi:hypothetical protein
MKKYVRCKESIRKIATSDDLALEIQKVILGIFPKSMVKAEFSKRMYASIWVYFTLGKDKSEYINGYSENDIAVMSFRIDGKGGKELPEDGSLTGDVQVENTNASFSVKPPEGSYLAFGRVKVPFKKISGPPEKIVDYIKKYFITFKKALQANRDNIPDEDLKLIGNKF